MTTPTGAADERERLLYYVKTLRDPFNGYEVRRRAGEYRVALFVTENEAEHYAAMRNVLTEEHGTDAVSPDMLAAQSAELERVRKVANDCREWVAEFPCRENGKPQPGQNELLDRIDDLAAPSAAGGEKELSEVQLFGGDLYSGIKP